MDRTLCLGVLLLYSFEIQGLQQMFVLHGNDLLLHVQESVVLDKKTDLFWKFNSTNNVVKCSLNGDPVVYDEYEGRAEVLGQNYSLLLKNVKHNDSGDYTAIVAGGKDKNVAEYKVTVQDPVSPGTLTVDSVSSSSDSCNITVTCSTADNRISSTFTCNVKNCSQAEEKSLNAGNSYSSLTVYLQENLVICNHSNQVSWEQSKKEIRPHCETKPASSAASSQPIIAGVVSIIVLIALIVLCIVIKGKRGNRENVPCEAPQDKGPGKTQSQNVSEDAPCPPTTTYAVVEFHHGPESTEKKTNLQPETVYAQVNRAVKPKSTDHQPTHSIREHATESVYTTAHE